MEPVVVGIAGGTASGKSTLAKALVEHLGGDCLSVVHDRYYRSAPEAARKHPGSFDFDHPDALETSRLIADLDALRAGKPVRLPRYDFTTSQRTDEVDPVEPRPWIVVEGILVLADPKLRARLDHTVFVDTPDDLRLLRRVRRDVAERGRSVEEVLVQYEATVRPSHLEYVLPSSVHAELVLDGTRDVQANLGRLLRHVGVGARRRAAAAR